MGRITKNAMKKGDVFKWDGFRADVEEYMIVEETGHSHWDKNKNWLYNCGGECVEKYVKYVGKQNSIDNLKKPMTNIVSLIKSITRTEPEKTFIKVGFIDEQENITEKGKEALNYILWQQNKEKLKELADKINVEFKEDNK